jgi:glycosyltransferase involved in cell wall biosynthesis
VAINVLFLHANGEWMRGSENALLSVLRGMDKNEFTPYLISGNPQLVERAREHGTQSSLHSMPEVMVDGTHFRLQFLSWARTVRRLASFIRTRNIQLVYCNGGSTSQVGYYAAKITRVPVVCHVHSPYIRRYPLLYRFHRVSKVIFVSKAIQESIRAKQRFRAECEVVYNGVDTVRFCAATVRDKAWRARLSLPADAVVFGQVSSLISRKGIDILLRSFQVVHRKYPQARLVLVGDGPERHKFTALADQLGVANKTVFAGNQPDPVPFYQHIIDINVLASRSDAFGLAVLEAGSCGLPSIGANVDGIPESVLDGQTGLLFSSEDISDLAEKMSTLLADAGLRRRLGDAASTVAVERFSIESYRHSIERIIRDQVSAAQQEVSATNRVLLISENVPK